MAEKSSMVDKVPTQLDEEELKAEMDVEIPEAIDVEEIPENVEIVEEEDEIWERTLPSSLIKIFSYIPFSFFLSTNTVNPFTVSLNCFSLSKEGINCNFDSFSKLLEWFKKLGVIIVVINICNIIIIKDM
mgnify:CR=1 FL=1